MIPAFGYAAHAAKQPLTPFQFERRELGPRDVHIEILYCGVCHSDVHQARDEWGGAIFPMVPGHEIVGRVRQVGAEVTKFRVGALCGVGCIVDACRSCESCGEGLEQFCEGGFTPTYNGYERGTKTPTHGGYADHIVVDESFVLRMPENLPLAGAAPLLCAGITTYSPLRRFGIGPGQRVGVVGLGGLGHMAVKLARAMGAEVVLFTSSEHKVEDGKRLGAHEVVVSSRPAELRSHKNRLHFILDTVAAPHNLDLYLSMLRRDGVLTLVGVPEKNHPMPRVGHLINRRRSLTGSFIGGIAETQEMLDFCAEHGVCADVEVIPIQQINEAYERMVKSDVKYRFVIDLGSLASAR